jgi:hypothetical protein
MARSKPKGFDPSMIDTIFEDFKALNPIAQKTVADVIALLFGKARKGATPQPVACPTDDECDVSECLRVAYVNGIHELVAICKAQDALDKLNEDEDA